MTSRSSESEAIRSFFCSGTLVSTKDGQKPIEEVAIGDLVLSFPHGSAPPKEPRKLREAEFRQVTAVASQQTDQLVELSIMDLAAGFKEVLLATPSSLIYQTNIGWSSASGMAFGSTLENSVFGNLLVTKARKVEGSVTVYGISVEEFGTYYTGRANAWMHC